jgi:hypothetical protein
MTNPYSNYATVDGTKQLQVGNGIIFVTEDIFIKAIQLDRHRMYVRFVCFLNYVVTLFSFYNLWGLLTSFNYICGLIGASRYNHSLIAVYGCGLTIQLAIKAFIFHSRTFFIFELAFDLLNIIITRNFYYMLYNINE